MKYILTDMKNSMSFEPFLVYVGPLGGCWKRKGVFFGLQQYV